MFSAFVSFIMRRKHMNEDTQARTVIFTGQEKLTKKI